MEDARDNNGEQLDDSKESVRVLLWCLETCLFHGMIPTDPNDEMGDQRGTEGGVSDGKKKDSTTNFWMLVEALYGRGSMSFGASIDMIKLCMNVKTPYGRCRAWLRQVLNQHAFEFNLRALFEDQAMTRKTYYLEAIVENREILDVFLTMIIALNTVGFELKVDYAELDEVRITNTKNYCMLRGAGVLEANGLYGEGPVKDGVLSYVSEVSSNEVFRAPYQPPKLNDEPTPAPTHRWFLGNPDKKVVYYFCPSAADTPPFEVWKVHPSGGKIPGPTLGLTFLESEIPPKPLAAKVLSAASVLPEKNSDALQTDAVTGLVEHGTSNAPPFTQVSWDHASLLAAPLTSEITKPKKKKAKKKHKKKKKEKGKSKKVVKIDENPGIPRSDADPELAFSSSWASAHLDNEVPSVHNMMSALGGGDDVKVVAAGADIDLREASVSKVHAAEETKSSGVESLIREVSATAVNEPPLPDMEKSSSVTPSVPRKIDHELIRGRNIPFTESAIPLHGDPDELATPTQLTETPVSVETGTEHNAHSLQIAPREVEGPVITDSNAEGESLLLEPVEAEQTNRQESVDELDGTQNAIYGVQTEDHVRAHVDAKVRSPKQSCKTDGSTSIVEQKNFADDDLVQHDTVTPKKEINGVRIGVNSDAESTANSEKWPTLHYDSYSSEDLSELVQNVYVGDAEFFSDGERSVKQTPSHSPQQRPSLTPPLPSRENSFEHRIREMVEENGNNKMWEDHSSMVRVAEISGGNANSTVDTTVITESDETEPGKILTENAQYVAERKRLQKDLEAIRERRRSQFQSLTMQQDVEPNPLAQTKAINGAEGPETAPIRSDPYTREEFAKTPIDWSLQDDIRIVGKADHVALLRLDPDFPGGDEIISFNDVSTELLPGKSSSEMEGTLSINVQVFDFRVVMHPKPHVRYLIRVSEVLLSTTSQVGAGTGPAQRFYDIKRRYTQFKSAHSLLAARQHIKATLPKLPRSKLIRSFEPNYLEKKRAQLNEYLSSLVEILKSVPIADREPLVSFLAVHEEDLSELAAEERMPRKRSSDHEVGWTGFHIPLTVTRRPKPGQSVPAKVGIGLQRFRCGSCGSLLSVKNGVRYCEYSELYHCNTCSSANAARSLPTRVLHHWDFKSYKVCDQVMVYLDDIYGQPIFCVSALNPNLFLKVKQLRHARLLRLQLTRMIDFLNTCRQGGDLRTEIDERGSYLMESTEMFSMRDFCDIRSKQLNKFLMEQVQNLATHITTNCATCSARGFVCEICTDDKPIYAFEIKKASACTGCKSYFHRQCIEEATSCPRCKRLRQRKERFAPANKK